tara:strand:- start:1642 stop:1818 length:177 start_codon:yes stop_codon:yes gene_type:complete
LGAIAQLGERLHGMQEVAGSIPASSTIPSLSNSHGLYGLVDLFFKDEKKFFNPFFIIF